MNVQRMYTLYRRFFSMFGLAPAVSGMLKLYLIFLPDIPSFTYELKVFQIKELRV